MTASDSYCNGQNFVVTSSPIVLSSSPARELSGGRTGRPRLERQEGGAAGGEASALDRFLDGVDEALERLGWQTWPGLPGLKSDKSDPKNPPKEEFAFPAADAEPPAEATATAEGDGKDYCEMAAGAASEGDFTEAEAAGRADLIDQVMASATVVAAFASGVWLDPAPRRATRSGDGEPFQE